MSENPIEFLKTEEETHLKHLELGSSRAIISDEQLSGIIKGLQFSIDTLEDHKAGKELKTGFIDNSVSGELDLKSKDLIEKALGVFFTKEIQWNPIDQPPEVGKDIIATYKFEQFDMGFYSSCKELSEGWCDFSFFEDDQWVAPTHWIYETDLVPKGKR